MHYARIENSIVVEIVNFNPAGKFHPSLTWVPCGGNVNVGDAFTGSEFTGPPAPALTVDERLAEVDLTRDVALRSGVVASGTGTRLDGMRFYADDTFIGELNLMVHGYATGVLDAAATNTIRTKAGELLQCSRSEIVTISAVVGYYRAQVYAASWAAKAQILGG